MDEQIRWREIEQPAGPPSVSPVDPTLVDSRRQTVYESYEAFLRARLAQLDRDRPSRWARDYSSVTSYGQSISGMRERLKLMLGFWVEPTDRPPLRVGDDETLVESEGFVARRFPLEILPGLETYAVELIPTTEGPHPGLLAQHGYGGTPELVCGLTEKANLEDYSYRSLGVRAVRRGFHVVAIHHPSGYGTTDDEASRPPGFPDHPRTYGKNRLHRLAFMVGGTLFGLDMLGSSRGIDLLMSRGDVVKDRIGIYGLSQGGMTALFLPAMDVRIKASVCSAYFNWRYFKMIGPHPATCYLDALEEDKFFTEILSVFSDADLVSLICPRAFAVEAGRKDSSVDFDSAAEEFRRASEHYDRLGLSDLIEFIPHAEGHVSATRRAFEFLEEHLGGSHAHEG